MHDLFSKSSYFIRASFNIILVQILEVPLAFLHNPSFKGSMTFSVLSKSQNNLFVETGMEDSQISPLTNVIKLVLLFKETHIYIWRKRQIVLFSKEANKAMKKIGQTVWTTIFTQKHQLMPSAELHSQLQCKLRCVACLLEFRSLIRSENPQREVLPSQQKARDRC